jgi:tol-pal system protein YbgF
MANYGYDNSARAGCAGAWSNQQAFAMRHLRQGILASGLVFGLMSALVPVAWAQNADWNSLFDRIIRIEHEVRAMKGAGGAGGGGDSAYRLTAIEEQLRNLAGQLSTMSQQMQQMQTQINELRQQKQGRAKPVQQAPASQAQTAAQQQPSGNEDLFYSNDDLDLTVLPEASEPLQSEVIFEQDTAGGSELAPGPQVLGQLVIENDSGYSPDYGSAGSAGSVGSGGLAGAGNGEVTSSLLPGTVETAALDSQPGSAGSADPEVLFKQSHDNLLKRRFGLAEAGFKTFLSRNKTHRRAGAAQYWLGETYYAQGRYKQAAQSFLVGYKTYPRDGKAASSLVKLGMSLDKLGQRKQACGAYAEVRRSYPKAENARKLAAREMQRGGC